MSALSKPATEVPNNLPAQLTGFVGRESETHEIERLLAGTRLLTLIGSGGCGKTRLALNVAERALNDYPDGVWWVNLASTNDPALVPSGLASVLGVREVPMQDLSHTLKDHLQRARALIVLDNCEHLATACVDLAEFLLRSCASLTLLTTSRAALGAEGETAWRVPSLPFPEDENDLPAEALWGYDALRLFAERAVAVRPDFRPTDENARAIAEICARLDGIPLAIELAAARMNVLTPEEITEALTDRFALLTAGRRTALPRQQTLQASVDWSYNFLSDAEQKLLQRLSVFSGGFTLESATAIVTGRGIEPNRLLEPLSDLVEKSLVQVETGGHRARYRLLATIRDYADAKLAPTERTTVEDAHLEFFLRLAERIESDIEISGTAGWIPTLHAELDNFRSAMDRAAATDRSADALGLATSLWLYWMEANRFGEARKRIQEYLRSGEVDDAPKAKALGALCGFALTLGDPATATEAGEECVALCNQIGEKRIRGRALYILAWIQTFTDLPRARSMLEESVAVARETKDPWWLAMALSYLSFVLTVGGRREEAQRVFDELDSLKSINHFANLRRLALEGFADICWGELEQAESVLEEGVALARASNDRFHLIWSLNYLGGAWTYAGDYGRARAALDESLDTGARLGVPILCAIGLTYLALLDYAEGNLDAADASLERSTAILGALRFDYPLVVNEWVFSEVELARGETSEALDRAIRVTDQPTSNESPLLRGSLLLVTSVAERRGGALRRAEQMAREALQAFLRAEARLPGVDCLEALGGLATLQGSPQEGARLFGAAESLRRATGYARFPVRTKPYEDDIQSARRLLGPEGFEKEWSRGAALSWEEAGRYASRSRGPRKRPSSGWESLTPTELQVVGHVTEGLSNVEIGERMFISRRTVQAHLSRVFAKLGISTRSELAAQSARRDI